MVRDVIFPTTVHLQHNVIIMFRALFYQTIKYTDHIIFKKNFIEGV